MKMKYVFLMLLILILSISAVSASENVTAPDEILSQSDDMVEIAGVNETECILNSASEYVVADNADNSSVGDNNSEKEVNVVIKADNMVAYIKENPVYEARLMDSNNNLIAGARVSFEINGKHYYKTTDDNGLVELKINLKAGKYPVKITYGKTTVTRTIKLFSSRVSLAKNIKTTYGNKVKYQLRILDNYGNLMKNKMVTFKVNKKVYKVRTNSKGIAGINLNYKSGKHTIRYSVDGLSGSNSYIVKNKVSFSILDWGNKGDVSKAKLIRENMPDNIWVKKAVAATKKGLPLLTFKGGQGKVIFITSGVHGNEISSQVACMKLIDYLTDNPIDGTVYVIPFVNLKAISHKVRHTGSDYNRIASKSGTIPNKIVKLVVKYKCDFYGDFHTTQPGGAPGKDVVMGSKTPNHESYRLSNYIHKNCHVSKIIYSYAGQSYPGAIADNVNKNGIPAVLCEVMLPHNTVTARTISLSLSMMKALLKFNSVI